MIKVKHANNNETIPQFLSVSYHIKKTINIC